VKGKARPPRPHCVYCGGWATRKAVPSTCGLCRVLVTVDPSYGAVVDRSPA
jgi:hypothetical protein